MVAFSTDACERNGVHPHPGLLDVKPCIFKKNANCLVRELVAVLGMDGFTFGEMKIKLRGRDANLMAARMRVTQVENVESSRNLRRFVKRPLNCVLRILSIAKYSEHRAVDPQSMTLIQLPESALRRMQAFVAGPAATIQIMVKDSNRYAATARDSADSFHRRRTPRYSAGPNVLPLPRGSRQGHDLVFTQYAVKASRQTRLDRPGD